MGNISSDPLQGLRENGTGCHFWPLADYESSEDEEEEDSSTKFRNGKMIGIGEML